MRPCALKTYTLLSRALYQSLHVQPFAGVVSSLLFSYLESHPDTVIERGWNEMANKDEPAKERYAYMLRIMGRNPDQLPMERVGEYIAAFADLLGAENLPTFAGIKKASTGLKAKVPYAREHHAHARMVVAKTEPSSRPGRAMSRLQQMIDQDDRARRKDPRHLPDRHG
jgi:hypothetical protein